jgi:hypothetical protein
MGIYTNQSRLDVVLMIPKVTHAVCEKLLDDNLDVFFRKHEKRVIDGTDSRFLPHVR